MTLNEIMEFDHVIEVHEDGSITDRPDIYAPELFNDELLGEGWKLLNGFSGQDRYAGPIMHQSEFIGGGMERFIRESPGVYVALVNYTTDDEGGEYDEPATDSWAVAYRTETE